MEYQKLFHSGSSTFWGVFNAHFFIPIQCYNTTFFKLTEWMSHIRTKDIIEFPFVSSITKSKLNATKFVRTVQEHCPFVEWFRKIIQLVYYTKIVEVFNGMSTLYGFSCLVALVCSMDGCMERHALVMIWNHIKFYAYFWSNGKRHSFIHTNIRWLYAGIWTRTCALCMFIINFPIKKF